MKKPNPHLTRTPSTASPISRTNRDCRHCGLFTELGIHPETGKATCLDRHRRDYRAQLAGRTPLVTSAGLPTGQDEPVVVPFRAPKRTIDVPVGTVVETDRGLARVQSYLGDEVHLVWPGGDEWLRVSDVTWVDQ